MPETKSNIVQQDRSTLGAGISDHVTIRAWAGNQLDAGTWLAYQSGTYYGGYQLYNNSNANNDKFSYYASFSAGTWTFRLYVDTYSNRGIFDLLIDDVSIGTKDCYAAAGPTPNVLFEITGVIVTAGRHKVSIKVTGHNGASSGYTIALIDGISAWRTA
jgi:hypothetical protein